MRKLLFFFMLALASSCLAQTSGLASPSGVWDHEGTILSPTQAEQFNATEPSVLYEGTPHVLTGTSGNIFKMWWTCGWDTTGLCYAESVDGEKWQRVAAPVIARSTSGPAHGYVFHYGSTYYYYAVTPPAVSTQMDRYESSDGITWTLTHSAVMTLGGAGTWDSAAFGNMYVIPSAGTWLMMYEAGGTGVSAFAMGVASSADQGVTWTKYGSNPVIIKGGGSEEAGGPEIHFVNGQYYVWAQCSTGGSVYPDDICRWHSPTFLSTSWVIDNSGNPVFTRAAVDDGSGNPIGQVADPSMVEVNGSVYMFYEGVIAQNGTTPDAFHMKLAVAPMPFTKLVQTNEGNATSFRSAGSFNTLNLSTCVYWDNDFLRTPCANSTGQFLIGVNNLQGGSVFPSLSQNIYYDGTNARYSLAGGGTALGTTLSSGAFAIVSYPTGSANAVAGGGVVTLTSSSSGGITIPNLTVTGTCTGCSSTGSNFTSATAGTPAITISNTASASTIQASFFSPNLPSSGFTYFPFGRDASHDFNFLFNYTGGSTDNLNIAYGGAFNGLTVYQNGGVSVGIPTAPPALGITAASVVAQNGFSGTKTAGSCVFTIVSGIITNVTGC